MRFLTLGLAALTLAGIAAARVNPSRTSSEQSLLSFETRPVLNHAVGQANTMLAHLQPSRLSDQAKGIVNGVSQGLTLYTAKSASRSSSAHTGMRRRQPRTSFFLVATMGSFVAQGVHAVDTTQASLRSPTQWDWATFDAVKSATAAIRASPVLDSAATTSRARSKSPSTTSYLQLRERGSLCIVCARAWQAAWQAWLLSAAPGSE